MFFGRFNFTITYRRCSWNVNPDAFSNQYPSEEAPFNPDTILPSSFVMAAVTWEIESLEMLNQPNQTQVNQHLEAALCCQ